MILLHVNKFNTLENLTKKVEHFSNNYIVKKNFKLEVSNNIVISYSYANSESVRMLPTPVRH